MCIAAIFVALAATPLVPHSEASGVDQMSDLTGGRAYATGQVEKAIAEAIGDAQACYTIGYFGPVDKSAGRYHKIRVTVSRPGIRIETIHGYYSGTSGPSPEARIAEALQEGVARLADDSGIGLRVTLENGETPEPAHLKIRIDARDLLIARQERGYRGRSSWRSRVTPTKDPKS